MSRARTLSRPLARGLLGVLAAVGLAESIASAFAYRISIDADDWSATANAIEAVPEPEPVWLATPWLGPLARHNLPRLAHWPSVAPPDLRGATRFHVLGHSGDLWSEPLQTDLEDLPPPTLIESRQFGGLTLTTYEQPTAGTVVADLITDWSRLTVSSDKGSCRGRGRRTCDNGRVGVAVAEVDYRARRCIKLELHEGATVTLRYPQMPTGTTLRGHVAVHDFNARLRSDSPLRLRVSIDETRAAQWLVTDAQAWWPFAVQTEPGPHDVELELTAPVGGTWQRSGYEPGRVHAFCIEMRAIEEGTP